MRRPDPVPASRQPQPERGPFPPSVQPLARIPTTPPRLRRRAGGTGEGHDTQAIGLHGQEAIATGPWTTDRPPAPRPDPCLPGGYHPVTPAPLFTRRRRAVSLEASMNNTLDVIFLGKDDARHARLIEALSHLGFNAPLPRTGRCVRALLPAPEPAGGAGSAAARRAQRGRAVARHRPGPGHRRHRRLPRRRKPDTHAAVRRRRLPVARSQRTGAGRGLAGAGAARGRHGRRAGRDCGQRRAAQRRMAAGQQGLDPDQPGRAPWA